MSLPHVVVLGAGPAGVGAAYELRRRLADRAVQALVLGCFILVLFRFLLFTYWNRCDPVLMLLSAVAITAGRSRHGAFVIGATAGMASAMKLHAALYVLPAAVAFVMGQASRSPLPENTWLAT